MLVKSEITTQAHIKKVLQVCGSPVYEGLVKGLDINRQPMKNGMIPLIWLCGPSNDIICYILHPLQFHNNQEQPYKISVSVVYTLCRSMPWQLDSLLCSVHMTAEAFHNFPSFYLLYDLQVWECDSISL